MTEYPGVLPILIILSKGVVVLIILFCAIAILWIGEKIYKKIRSD